MNNTFTDLLNKAEDLSDPMREAYEAGMALEKQNAELRAHVARLRNSLGRYDEDSAIMSLLNETPPQSLREIRREAMEKYREECAKWYEREGWLLDEDDVSIAIRSMPLPLEDK